MAKNRMDLLELLRKRGLDGDVDFVREALRVLVEGIMDAEVSAQIGAQHGERNPERLTHRNGYRSRAWDARVGTMESRIPKVREGSYFPSLLARLCTFQAAQASESTSRWYRAAGTFHISGSASDSEKPFGRQPQVAATRAMASTKVGDGGVPRRRCDGSWAVVPASLSRRRGPGEEPHEDWRGAGDGAIRPLGWVSTPR